MNLTATNPAYRILTPRLLLRCWDPADARALEEAILSSLEHLRPWMPWALDEPIGLPQRVAWLRERRARFDRGEDFDYAIFERDGQTVLGAIGLLTRAGLQAREIGYWIRAGHTGQGLAGEAAAALTRAAFEVDHVARVEIHCDPANVASAAVPRKLGYTLDATLRKRHLEGDGTWSDTMVWSLLAEEYPGSPAAKAEIEAWDAAGERLL
jgi:RimJ/RimL family protein N-acetyltransferase